MDPMWAYGTDDGNAVSSYTGQMIIPVPLVGAVIGNAVGTMIYQIAKKNLSAREQKLFEEYLISVQQLDKDLQDRYQLFVQGLSESMKQFMDILDRAFSPDIRTAFNASVDLAKEMGVPADDIIDSKEKLYEYFLG